jgi:glycosyltransferase XagB
LGDLGVVHKESANASSRNAEKKLQNSSPLEVPKLPQVPRELLPRLFGHLDSDDTERVLRHKIVPVAWLPHTTLYAKKAGHALHDQTVPANKVIAEISNADYHECIEAFMQKNLLNNATVGLRRSAPIFSAHQRLSNLQIIFSILSSAILAALFAILPFDWVSNTFSIIFAFLYSSIIFIRIAAIFQPEPNRKNLPRIHTADLPIFSILVPVFKETSVLAQLINSLLNLDYPHDKLDIKIIVEALDEDMHCALEKFPLPYYFEVVTVPTGKPQTKPRALNYALQFARGTLLTIYDAEDIPSPMQLRVAAAAFKKHGSNMVCLQGELAFYNANENWLTRQFSVEYATLFRVVLPALATLKLPLPLGGTSNHFRTDALRAVGGWDPYNVTEDADLGIRFARLGYDVSTLPSITYEEANPEVRNWIHQRSRWLKGFLQTWLVHMRHPIRLFREVGFFGFIVVQASTLGVVVSATFHPIFFARCMYQFYIGLLTDVNTSDFQIALNAVFLFNLVLGFAVATASATLALRRKGKKGWFWIHASLPVYWWLMSIAGWKALWEFVWKPFHWNKTRHGISKLHNSA